MIRPSKLFFSLRCPDGEPGGYIPLSLRGLIGLLSLGYRIKLVTYAAIVRAANESPDLLDSETKKAYNEND